jgi:hypothetical protein
MRENLYYGQRFAFGFGGKLKSVIDFGGKHVAGCVVSMLHILLAPNSTKFYMDFPLLESFAVLLF